MGLDREIIIMAAAEDFSKVVMATSRSIEAQPSALRISQFGCSGRTCSTHQQAESPSEFREGGAEFLATRTRDVQLFMTTNKFW